MEILTRYELGGKKKSKKEFREFSFSRRQVTDIFFIILYFHFSIFCPFPFFHFLSIYGF